ncbi:MAG: hypothetical protein ACKVP4_12220 [Hyphomicrobium sp.]
MSGTFHENFEQKELPLPPERSTGLVFAAICLVVAYFWRSDRIILTWALGAAATFTFLSFFAPLVLRPLNVAWMRFALLLSKVMNPIVMLALFIIAIVPAGLIMQLRSDPLRRRRDSRAKSYWTESKSTLHSNMRNQF